MKVKRIRLIIEIMAWLFFLGVPLFFLPAVKDVLGSERMPRVLFSVLVTHSYLILFYYFNYYYALPKFYFTRRYFVYFGTLVLLLLLIVAFNLSDPMFNPVAIYNFRYSTVLFLFTIKIRFILIFLLSLGLLSYSRLMKAEEEKLKSELNLLKAQVNPHFLFNTLNSIYALSVKKSDYTPESVTRLASIMRYVISETSSETVELSKELKYIRDYIDLERLRLTEKVKLNFSVDDGGGTHNIAPLIFIPLIENAFRYGVSTTENAVIDISIRVSGDELKLNVYNTMSKASGPGNGTGIANMKKRLGLIYPGKYRLAISSSENSYDVQLNIKLT